jgi:hypothetical protein
LLDEADRSFVRNIWYKQKICDLLPLSRYLGVITKEYF